MDIFVYLRYMRITFIGDIHGKTHYYNLLTQNFEKTYGLGDFGFKDKYDWHKANIDPTKHKMLQGNHDYRGVDLEQYDFVLPDYGFDENLNMFWVRGADSIDKSKRTEGVDWFRDEEINYSILNYEVLPYYEQCKPKIMISHDCPQSIFLSLKRYKYSDKSVTREALQAMFEIHQPEIWLFGHHHFSWKQEINNTKFICLNELETLTLDTETLQV